MEKSPERISDSTVVMTTFEFAAATSVAGIIMAAIGKDSKTRPMTAVARLLLLYVVVHIL